MRALLIAVGSRGDAEPFCALGSELIAHGHAVDLFLQDDLRSLSPPGAALHRLPFTQADFYKFVGAPTHGADHPNPRVRFVGVVADIIAELVLPCMADVLAAGSEASVVVASSLARPLGILASRKLCIPVCLVNLQPLAPTAAFPHSSDTEACVDAIIRGAPGSPANAESYWILERFQDEFMGKRLAAACEELGAPPVDFEGYLKPAYAGELDGVIVATAVCEQLVPFPTDIGPNSHSVGALAAHYIPDGWTPPLELEAFLASCATPPVCVGYGSMPFGQVDVVLEALQAAGKQAVLVGDALKVPDDGSAASLWAASHVCQVAAAPYAWLLPRCGMMLSHGGAGVVNATLRAGIPPVVTPLMGDQFFWAALLEARHVGVRAGSSLGAGLCTEDLVEGIRRAQACLPGAQAVGEAMRAKPTGSQALVRILEHSVSEAERPSNTG